MRGVAAAVSLFAIGLCACEPDVSSSGTRDEKQIERMFANATLTAIGTNADGLDGPRGLAFNPVHHGELWVVNENDEATVTYFDVGTRSQRAQHVRDPAAAHFMANVSSIAFSDEMRFGTCQESEDTDDDTQPPDDFMGPTLWSADMRIYGHENPDAIAATGEHLGSHLDMLHESPLCMGIAWETGNAYWTFDGLTDTISRADFVHDHGPGFDDHSDGVVKRFVDVPVKRVAGVPSGMVFARDEGTVGVLYVADTGHGRVLRVDPSTASLRDYIAAREQGVQLSEWTGAKVDVVVAQLGAPSGIVRDGDTLYVADNATSIVHAIDRRTGREIAKLDTKLARGSLMGLALDERGALWFVDFAGDRVLRVDDE